MAEADVPADVLTDLRTDHNALSVWRVQPDLANIDVALTALASNRQRLDKLDYTLLDEETLPAMQIRCVMSDGSTPYLVANTTAHRDLVELTVQKVARLAQEMIGLQRVRVPEKQVKRLLCDALERGVLDRSRIDPRLLVELELPSAM
jgi:hypothetical protein